MTFEQLNLNPNIFKALSSCGYSMPTAIQARSIPDILNGKDVVASAQTGTGKTAAFVLPVLHRLSLSPAKKNPRVLILSPTRELATQITDAVNRYGKFMKFNSVSLVGGMPYRQQLRALSRPLDIVIATPGRLLDHVENRRLKLSDVEMLVLDEADRMLDMGFIDDVMAIAKATASDRQTLLFSATVDDQLTQVVRKLLKNPVRIETAEEKKTPVKIEQDFYMTDHPQHKAQLLAHFLENENIFKAIIFSATKVNADRLANDLRDQGFSTAALHGDLKQNVRNRTLDQLRRGKIQFLVATDVAARGIDINDITHVFNYDLPRSAEDYVHRIGRTGRAGREGVAISFVSRVDGRCLQQIERYTNQKAQLSVIEGLEPKSRGFNPTESKKKRGKRSNEGRRGASRFSDRDGGKKRVKFSDRDGAGHRATFSDRDNNSKRAKFTDRDDSKRSKFTDRDDSKRANFSDRDGKRAKFTDRADSKRSKFSDRDGGELSLRFADRNGDSKRLRFSDRDGDSKRSKFSDRDGDSKRSKFSDRDNGSKRSRFSDRDVDNKRSRFSDRDGDNKRSRFTDRDGDNKRPRFSDRDSENKRSSFSAKDGGKRKSFADKNNKGKSEKPSNMSYSKKKSEGKRFDNKHKK